VDKTEKDNWDEKDEENDGTSEKVDKNLKLSFSIILRQVG
jgi:hypothetical protein